MMAVLSDELRYLFIMAPRTGCTALSVHLVKNLEGEWLPPADVRDDDGGVLAERKHTKLADLFRAGLLTRDQAAELLVFTSVRNPFDSLVSLHAKLINQYVPLLEDPDSFVHQKPQMLADIQFAQDHSFSEWVVWKYDDWPDDPHRHLYGGFIDGVDRIMKFERLQEDFDDVMESLGVMEGTEIPVLNVTEGRPESYRDQYTDAARRTVERVFAADLERFGYAF